jgi:signal transduction histidine kinase
MKAKALAGTALGGGVDATAPEVRPEGRTDAAPAVHETSAELLTILAHELSNAVTPLRVHAHILSEKGLAAPDAPGSLASVRALADRIAALSSEMLDLARMREGRLSIRPQPIDLQDEARRIVQAFQPLAEEAKVWLRLEPMPPCPVHADPLRMQQVLSNLLTNALRATPAGGRVLVEVRRQGHGAEVRITDTGVGFTGEDARSFMQGSPTSHRRFRNGMGLGLQVSRGLVEAHGGRLMCASDGPGSGATFAFTVPDVGEKN